MAEPLLAFQGIVLRSEEGRSIFDDMDWTLARGARFSVRAPQGGEGFPLLRLAAGLVHPQEGTVLLDGVPIGPYSFDHPFLRRGALGWVPRNGGLLVNQTLLANVALPLMFTKRMGRSAAETLAARALEQAGLAGLADRRPHALEAREQWLGALVRAELMKPELWLVDPPPERPSAPALAILERALASPGALVILGGDSWLPQGSVQGIAWVNGRLVPGEG